MIRELPNNAKGYILEVYNKFRSEDHFPDKWQSATVIAFSKPDKDYSKADNYRPIALASCLARTMERKLILDCIIS